jgi:hypothetical protein
MDAMRVERLRRSISSNVSEDSGMKSWPMVGHSSCGCKESEGSRLVFVWALRRHHCKRSSLLQDPLMTNMDDQWW